MEALKRIALVAHDDRKDELVQWVRANRAALTQHRFWSTGTTGGRVREACPELDVTLLKSGPLGGDQQLGARISEGGIDILIFFIDPLSPMPHDVDVKALTRLSTLYDVATATNRATADFLITSPLFGRAYPASAGGGSGEPSK